VSKERYDRRRFLGGAAAGAGAMAVATSPALAAFRDFQKPGTDGIPLAKGGSFEQGVAAGQPTTSGITLWTRVEGIDDRSVIRWEVARDKDFKNVVRDGKSIISKKFDFTAKARVPGLKPGDEYFYRFETKNENSPAGRFRTTRPKGSRETVRIGFFSCQEFIAGFYAAHRDLAEQDLDLVVCLGDYIYEQGFAEDVGGQPPVREDTAGDNGDAQTLDDYREKYQVYHTDEDLLKVRENFAMMAIWDDHEVEDNYADQRPGGATENRRTEFRKRRADGYRAFFENMPRIRFDNRRDQIYSRLAMGNADIFFLDERAFRDDQPCNEDDSFFSEECPPEEYNEEGRTLLGRRQLKELKKFLERSEATWKLVANQVMIMSLDSGPRNPLNTDSWDGYGDERREIIDHIEEKGIDNVSFVTGDIHTFFAGNVHRSGRDDGNPDDNAAGFRDGPPRATEFVGGSITSPGVADRPARNECERNGIAGPLDAAARDANTHLKFSNQAYKGYALVEAKGGELEVTYRAVRDHRQETSEVFQLARFKVADGDPRVDVVEDNAASAASRACGGGPLQTPPGPFPGDLDDLRAAGQNLP